MANRGEIARRIFRTCRELGVSPVAVFSDADADSPHVAEADVAVRLPGAAPTDTYLRADLLVQAAISTGADAVHPGYGFLSEDADFARAVVEAGLTWVGPPAEAIAAMGSKVTAKRLMADSGVAVLPEPELEAITESDLPVLIKASAGGGGRGMRVVHRIDELAEAVDSAAREARSAFGDSTVFCEPMVEDARHVEVQLLADEHGTVWALGERECSIQRRHQKIVEETPSPAVGPELRARLCDAAVTAARAIGYVGAGTVEFLLAPDGNFFFLEVNTRLQVEHPVTECVHGLDLVALQLEVAEGSKLPPTPPVPSGHAIEVRLYAEDPSASWKPQSGRLHRFAVPGVDTSFAVPARFGLRLDSGVDDGYLIGVHYDPMLAKVIAWGPTRAAAARKLAAALAAARIHGPVTNRDLLVRVLRYPDFLEGGTDTRFLQRHGIDGPDGGGLVAPLADEHAASVSALAAALADAAVRGEASPVTRGLPIGFRNVPSQPQRKSYDGPAGRIDVAYRHTRDGLAADGHESVSLVRAVPDEVILENSGVRRTFVVATYPPGPSEDVDVVHVDSSLGPVSLRPVARYPDPAAQVAAGSLLAPMPASVGQVRAEQGDRVVEGQTLLVLEAMKMEHPVTAPASGVLTELRVEPGKPVDAGVVLAVVTAEEFGDGEGGA
ncbi:biotin carboxylase N-terminal domain-containing protein [Parasphingorhabdus pacifica]